ncbi:MAG TPA: Rv3654c family TadE-like protein [Microbacteriaceae bacterium]|nr:Rv3654c family TadE-like protein [Microbacteriaceae bacterium]
MFGRRQVSARACDPERGAGTVLAIGLVAATIGLALLVAPSAAAAVARHRVAAAADAAAIAAAAVVAGFDTGLGDDPCAVAALVGARHGADIVACEIDGLTATVRAQFSTAAGVVRADATAGVAR